MSGSGELVGYRLAAYDTPLWRIPNRAVGRYNDRRSPPTQYLCTHPAGPWAELLRRHGLRDPTLLAEFRHRLWVVRIPLPHRAITFDDAPALGLDAADLVADDWRACQDLALRLQADDDEPDAFVVPSAALPGTTNIVAFGPRLAIPFDAEPIDPEDLPTALAAEDARPVESLLGLVRYRGMRHRGHQAWADGVTPPPVDTPVLDR